MAINNAINQYPIVDALLGSWTPGAGTITSADSILTAMQKISGSSVSLSGNNVWTGTNSFGNTVTFSTLTASTVPYLDASKNLTSSAVTPTELGYVSGVTSAIQTQLGTKVNLDQTVGQTIGATGARLTMLWATDITVTNAITGSVTGNAGTVTTNANLTGPITSVGNATSIASQTGTGTTFAMSANPTFTGTAVFDRIDANTLHAVGSGGLLVEANNGTDVALFGAGGSSGVTFYGGVNMEATLTVTSTLTIGGQATATSVGMEIGNTAGGTPFIDFKSSAVDYNVRIINGTSTTLSFLGATGGYFFDTTVNSIYAKVATTANATLTTITQGLTIAGNLVTSAYVADGYTAGLTWSSTDDNASKPKAGIFACTTGSGSYIILGTSNAYATGIVNIVSVGPDGDIAANRYSSTSTATTQNVIFAQSDSLTTGKLGYFYSNSGDTNSRSLVSIVNDSSSATGTTALNIQQDSTGNSITITQAGALATNKDGLLVNCTGANTNGNTSAMYVLQNNVSSTAPAIRVLHTGNGRGLSMTVSNTTDNALDIIASSMTTGRGASIYSNSSSSSQFVLLDLTSANASATGMIPLAIANAASVSTNYKIMMYLGGNFIYKSNGTTPNGFLSGSAGDICLGADSGKAYYCSGGTTWVAM